MTDDIFGTLSDDARVVAGISLAPLEPGRGTLSFGTPSRITPRGRAALDELVAAGIARADGDRVAGPLSYVPLADCSGMAAWGGANLRLVTFDLVAAPDPRDELVWSDGSRTPVPTAGGRA